MSKIVEINHDLHQHTTLSSCASDEEMTTERLLLNAVENNYETICIANHLWDSAVPGASDWYKSQDVENSLKALPLPKAEGIDFYFGCETEYCGKDKLGLSKESFDLFDFIVIPVNHFHMIDFVRPARYNTEALVAELMLERLEELQELDLPWRKIGIAHFTVSHTFKEGNHAKVFDHMPGERLFDIFKSLAKKGVGIELNAGCFLEGWKEDEESFLRPYLIAKDAGSKFYFASDAHSLERLAIKDILGPVAKSLALTESDIYRIEV